jgi:hypothetical protein
LASLDLATVISIVLNELEGSHASPLPSITTPSLSSINFFCFSATSPPQESIKA